jgi:hypothetical protein
MAARDMGDLDVSEVWPNLRQSEVLNNDPKSGKNYSGWVESHLMPMVLASEGGIWPFQ